MTVRACLVLPLVPSALAGCFHLPARVCLTPPYDAPAGFSETYHAALAQREPILRPGNDPVPPGVFVGGPAIYLPGATTVVEPPMEW